MRKTPLASHAIVRGVPETYGECIRPDSRESIDLQLARAQHDRYCRALSATGVHITRMAADDAYPDCCFVEDPALVIDDLAVVLNMGAPSRRGESEAVRRSLPEHKRTVEIAAPATLEGGDVLQINSRLYVGISERSNREGFDSLRALLEKKGLRVIAVKLRDTLHLKAVCSYLGENHVVIRPGHFDESIFEGYEQIKTARGEGYCANSLAINGTVLVPAGFPETRNRIECAGFETVELSMSEFRKGGGGVSCLSIRYS